MNTMDVTQLHLGLGILFGISYLIGSFLYRYKIPGVMGALIAATIAHYLPFGKHLTSSEFLEPLAYLGDMGVLFLLFFVGLQIDIIELFSVGRDIVRFTSLKLILVTVSVASCMLALGFSVPVALIVALTQMPTAEAIVIPILDDFRLLRTRVGELIVGSSVLDDIIEMVMIAWVSLWISHSVASPATDDIAARFYAAFAYVALVIVCYRWVMPWLTAWIPRKPSKVILFAVVILLGFAGLSDQAGLGMTVGALCAGIVTRPVLLYLGALGDQINQTMHAISHGFFAQLFFFWVGLHIDLEGALNTPWLTALLLLVSSGSKMLSALALVPLRHLSLREACALGISTNAGLTTELIVAQLLLNAKLINTELFTALVTATSLTTFAVPLLLPFALRNSGEAGIGQRLCIVNTPKC